MCPAAAALMHPAGVVQVLASLPAAVLADQAEGWALREVVLVASAAVPVAAASAEAGDADGWSQRGAGFFQR
jgi:hypothetical protein